MQYKNYHKEPPAKILHRYPAQNLLKIQEPPCEELLCIHAGKGHYGLLIIELTMMAQVFYTPNCDFFWRLQQFFFCSSFILKT